MAFTNRIDMSGYGSGASKPRVSAPRNSRVPSQSTFTDVISPSGQRYHNNQPVASTTPRIASNPIGRISQTTVQPAAVAPPPAPPVPSIEQFLGGDTAYQQQLAALQKALADYEAQMGQQKTQYGVDYSAKLNELNLGRQNSIEDLQNDFASRGLLQSGLFDNNLTETNTMFDRREGDLGRAKGDFEAGLAQAFANFKSEQGLTGTRAKNEALARRAAQYGV